MSLRKTLIGVLSTSPGLDAKGCLAAVAERYRRVSKQALYQELRELLGEGIVVRVGTRYSLNLPWVVDTLMFAEETYLNYVRTFTIERLLEGSGRKGGFPFVSLQAADDFWVQAILLLLSHTGASSVYEWHPTLWFLLLSDQREQRFHRARARHRAGLGGVVSEAPPLNHLLFPRWERKGVSGRFGKPPSPKVRQSHLSVIGEYVVTVRFSAATAAKLSRLFEHREVTDALGASVLSRREGIVVDIEHDPARAEQLAAMLAPAER